MKKQMQAIRWVMTLATILVLALLAWQCVDIYLEGNRPSNLDANGVYRSPVFSVEIVEARLRPLLPVLTVYGLMTLGALILQSTGKGVRPRGSHSPEDRLHLLKAHVATLPDEAKALERQRRVICMVATVAVLACAVPCLVYLLDREHFTSWDLEQVMGQMLLHVAPWIAACLCSGFRSFLCLRPQCEAGNHGPPGPCGKGKAGAPPAGCPWGLCAPACTRSPLCSSCWV